jgi:hypothetical protein
MIRSGSGCRIPGTETTNAAGCHCVVLSASGALRGGAVLNAASSDGGRTPDKEPLQSAPPKRTGVAMKPMVV